MMGFKLHGNIGAAFVFGAMLATLVTLASPVQAQGQDNVSSKENTPTVFVPTSAWLVGPISVMEPEKGQDMPCLMTNHYDNGYSVRISGNDREILAVAIDFRKDLFEAGNDYDLGLKVGDYQQTLSAAAYDSSTLVMNTDRSTSLYSEIKTAKKLVVTFGKTDLPFSLLSASDGLTRLSSCANTSQDRDNARTQSIENSLRDDFQSHTKTTAQPLEPIDAISSGMNVNNNVSAEAESAAVVEPDTETNNLGAILDGFLKKADEPLAPNPKTGTAEETARSFPAEAVERPIISTQPTTPQTAQQATPQAGVMQWQAQQGGSLKDILNVWTSHKKVGLLWGVEDSYYLPRRFAFEGTFEDAIRAVLAEFQSDELRPRGKLYNDTETGKAFLLVEYDTGE